MLASSVEQSPAVSHRRRRCSRRSRPGSWTGRASQLSEDHVQWTFIDEIAEATRDPGRAASSAIPASAVPSPASPAPRVRYPPRLLLQRRSAVAFDGRGSIDARGVLRDAVGASMPRRGRAVGRALVGRADSSRCCSSTASTASSPASTCWCAIRRRSIACAPPAAATFAWTPAHASLPLFAARARRLPRARAARQLRPGDRRRRVLQPRHARRLRRSLEEFGPAFYRHLFWESGVVGQVLYLEAEAAGARGTGIGCFYDDPVHDVLGLTGTPFRACTTSPSACRSKTRG